MSRTETEDGVNGANYKLAGLRARHSALSSRLASLMEADGDSTPRAAAPTVPAAPAQPVRAERQAIADGGPDDGGAQAHPFWPIQRRAEILVASNYRLPRPVWHAGSLAQTSGRRISTSASSRIAV